MIEGYLEAKNPASIYNTVPCIREEVDDRSREGKRERERERDRERE